MVDSGGTKFKLISKTKLSVVSQFNPVALRKAKNVCNFGHSECNKVK